MSKPRDQHVKRLAKAVRRHSRTVAQREDRHPRYAEILSLTPIKAQINEANLDPIEEDNDLVIGQWVRYYDRKYGLAVGDTLVLHLMSDHDFLAVEVISDTDTAP